MTIQNRCMIALALGLLLLAAGCSAAVSSGAADMDEVDIDIDAERTSEDDAVGESETGAETDTDVGAEGDGLAEGEGDGEEEDVAFDRWGFPVGHPLLIDRFFAIAHRGGGRQAPEESMEAYRKAAAAGVDMLEMDLHATSDGVIVLHHDAAVDRITDGTGLIREMTFAQLRALDAGYAYTPDEGATYPYRGVGVRVATFREVLEAFPDALFSVEIKQSSPSIVDAVLAIIAETGREDRVILVSFNDSVLIEIREKNPRIVTGAGLGEMLTFTTLTEADYHQYDPPCPILQLNGVTTEQLALAHALGMKVQVWTVNDADEMRGWIEMGVDGVMTDDPVLLENVINDMGR